MLILCSNCLISSLTSKPLLISHNIALSGGNSCSSKFLNNIGHLKELSNIILFWLVAK